MHTPFAPSFAECRDLFTRLSTEDGEWEFSCHSYPEGRVFGNPLEFLAYAAIDVPAICARPFYAGMDRCVLGGAEHCELNGFSGFEHDAGGFFQQPVTRMAEHAPVST